MISSIYREVCGRALSVTVKREIVMPGSGDFSQNYLAFSKDASGAQIAKTRYLLSD